MKKKIMKYNDFDQDDEKKKGFHIDIEKETINNDSFRKVLYTGEDLQLVLMSIQPNEDIGMEIHKNDQFFRVESGKGLCIINGNEYKLKDGDSIVVPAGAEHNVINKGDEPLKVYTIYAPPHHKDGIEFKTKDDAEKSKEEFDGKTTEE